MRGIAPLIVSLCALAWLGEAPTPMVWVGIVLICGGVLSLGLAGFHWRDLARFHAGWALANAVIIAAYTLVDAGGVRAPAGRRPTWSGFHARCAAVFTLDLLVKKQISWWFMRASSGCAGLVGGALSAAAYGVVLWAMTRAPVAAVAALRETSVIFAALIGAWLLKEGPSRAASPARPPWPPASSP